MLDELPHNCSYDEDHRPFGRIHYFLLQHYTKMKSPLDHIRVKQKILEIFNPRYDPVVAAQALSDDKLEAMLDVIESSIPFRKPTQNQALSMFLFAGVRRFDRWFPPFPFVVPPTHAAELALSKDGKGTKKLKLSRVRPALPP